MQDINNRDYIFMKMKDYNIEIYKKYKFGHSDDQNTFLMSIWSLSQFLDHSSQTLRFPEPQEPWDHLLSHLVFCPQFQKSLQSHEGEVGVLCYWVTLESTQGWGLVSRGSNHEQKAGTLSHPLISGNERGVGASIHHQRPIR